MLGSGTWTRCGWLVPNTEAMGRDRQLRFSGPMDLTPVILALESPEGPSWGLNDVEEKSYREGRRAHRCQGRLEPPGLSVTPIPRPAISLTSQPTGTTGCTTQPPTPAPLSTASLSCSRRLAPQDTADPLRW